MAGNRISIMYDQLREETLYSMLICYLLWRVETLSDLSNPQPQSLPTDETTTEEMEDNSLSPTIRDNIEALLRLFATISKHCYSSIALIRSFIYSTI